MVSKIYILYNKKQYKESSVRNRVVMLYLMDVGGFPEDPEGHYSYVHLGDDSINGSANSSIEGFSVECRTQLKPSNITAFAKQKGIDVNNHPS